MRIGTNHGSLSDRIMSRYGDSPLGMVESALEFIRIAEAENFHNIVLSMKASNTQVMVQAYRMLVNRMMQENMNYPLHLGVTEAGEGEDGRIKSAVGIGTLLEDGLGDTIRVSLTEEPELEIPVARALAERYRNRSAHNPISEVSAWPVHPFEHQRRASRSEENIGGKSVPVVVSDFRFEKPEKPSYLYRVGYQYVQESDKWNIQDQACDYVYTGDAAVDFEIPGTLGIIQNAAVWDDKKVRTYPLFTTREALSGNFKVSGKLNFLLHDAADFSEALFLLLKETNWVLVLQSSNMHAMPELRRFVVELMQRGIDCPILVYRDYTNESDDAFQLYAATDCGALLNDGLVDGIWLQRGTMQGNQKFINQTAFGILQAARARISKTEYISCPSCGRTLFDLQETTAKIRKRTDHLKGLKIGIMGCIVNGPGEMADADFGYVGTGVGKITLYKGREVVKRNVDSEHAVDELIGLIKENNCWVEPSAD
jgi:(E)-4-hydroxy-3-methylbut-2-enyl-diphosphate synthase